MPEGTNSANADEGATHTTPPPPEFRKGSVAPPPIAIPSAPLASYPPQPPTRPGGPLDDEVTEDRSHPAPATLLPMPGAAPTDLAALQDEAVQWLQEYASIR